MSLDKAQDVNQIAERIRGVMLHHGESLKISQLAQAMDLDRLVVMRALAVLEANNKVTRGNRGWRAV